MQRASPHNGLPDGRIEPRALVADGAVALAGTPSGLLVWSGDQAGLVGERREITAVRATGSGLWIGYRGGVQRVRVVMP